jgi:hypothetical protein
MRKIVLAMLSLLAAAVLAHASDSASSASASPGSSPTERPGCTVTCDGRATAFNLRQCVDSCRGTCELICPSTRR